MSSIYQRALGSDFGPRNACPSAYVARQSERRFQSFLFDSSRSAIPLAMLAGVVFDSDASLPSIVCSKPFRSVQRVPGPA